VVTTKAGDSLFTESTPPAVWLLLAGEVSLESSTGAPALAARGGDVIGSMSTMAGRGLGRTAVVRREAVALRIDREDLLTLTGERPELLRQLFAGLFRNEAFVS
jgi:CRP-like cAMP-binding protein